MIAVYRIYPKSLPSLPALIRRNERQRTGQHSRRNDCGCPVLSIPFPTVYFPITLADKRVDGGVVGLIVAMNVAPLA